MAQYFTLRNDDIRRNAIKAIMAAEDDSRLTIAPAQRSGEQNSMFHALCDDISRSGLEWFGKPRKLEEWKVLLVSGHTKATDGEVEIVPGLEGELVNIRESTSRMGVARASSLIEYTLAFAAMNGVDLTETRKGGFLDLQARAA
jgi:hypothetical protein